MMDSNGNLPIIFRTINKELGFARKLHNNTLNLMKNNNKTIYVVDDDAVMCDALRDLFESVYYKVETYLSAAAFLAKFDPKKLGCLIIDVRMPNISGLELLEQLNVRKNRLPAIMISGYGDVYMAIRAMKLGAIDFVLKPFNDQSLLETVQKYIQTTSAKMPTEQIQERINCLSARELEVLHRILDGKLNKEIAYELNISMSTVEVHRANIMRKMQAKTLAQLVKDYLQCQFEMELFNVK